MASFYAELHVEGSSYRVVHCSYECHQATNSRGRVQAKVRHAPLELVLDVPDDDLLLAWAHAPHKPLAGEVVFYDVVAQTAHETIAFSAGECVQYAEQFASGAAGDGAYVCQLTITAPSFELRAGGPAVVAVAYNLATSASGTLPEAAAPIAAVASAAPAAAPPTAYLTTPMDPDYAGEETGAVWGTAVKYLSAEERQAYAVTIKPDGLAYNAQGELLDTKTAGTVTGKGKAIFVLSETGEIYASLEQQAGLFHHSSFLAGAPVAAAGEMRVVAGVITSVSNRSGHYTPDQSYTQQLLEQLWRSGAKDTDQITVEDFDH